MVDYARNTVYLPNKPSSAITYGDESMPVQFVLNGCSRDFRNSSVSHPNDNCEAYYDSSSDAASNNP